MQESVEERGGDGGVAEDLASAGDRPVGGEHDRGFQVALVHDLEQRGRGLGREWQVAEFVDLCGYPHRLTYAETATMPRLSTMGSRLREDAGFLGRDLVFVVGIVTS